MVALLFKGLYGALNCVVSPHDLKMIPLVFQNFVVWNDVPEP